MTGATAGGAIQGFAAAGDIHLTQQFIQPVERPPLFWGVPNRPDHFVGRAALVKEVAERLLVGENTALSAQGLPGVGKTTLAVALAHHRDVLAHFHDGVLWAGLGPQADATQWLGRWATALGLDVSHLPAATDRATAIKNAIGLRHLLLVIDDAWDVETARLLRCGGPHCCHLLTTRDQALARAFAGAAQALSVPALPDDPAFTLLRTLAPDACALNPPTAQQLAAAVGGLPLAIELLAGYLNAPEHAYFADLQQQALADLANPQRRLDLACERLGAPGQTVTLQQTITLSLEPLPTEAVTAFYALGAFAAKPARFDRTAAETVAQTDAATLALLAARNMVEIEDGSLALHQTLADAARQQTPDEAILRHRDHYLALVDEDRNDWQRIETIYPQITYCWQQLCAHNLDAERAIDFTTTLSTYQRNRGLWQDRLAWLEHGLAVAQNQPHVNNQARMLNNLGAVHDALGEKQQALIYYEQALPLQRQVGDKGGEATTLNNLGLVYADLGEKRQALIYYEQALPLRRQVGDRWGEATTLNNLGAVYDALKDKPQALDYYEQALPLRRQVGDKGGEATTLTNLGKVYVDLGEKQQALDYYAQALPLQRQVGDKGGEATTLINLGAVYDELKDKQQALDYYEQALSLYRQVNDRWGEATTLNNLGKAYADLGEKQQALDYYNQALLLRRQVGDRWGESVTQFNLAMVYEALGDLVQAETHLHMVVVLEEAIHHPDLESDRTVLARMQQKRKKLGIKE